MDPRQGNGGERTPTTQGSVRSDDPGPPPVVAAAAVGYAVGTPDIPGDEEDYASEIQAPSSPRPRHLYSSDLSKKSQDDQSLQLVTGELAPEPPKRRGESEQVAGEHTSTPSDNAPPEEAQAESLQEKNQSEERPSDKGGSGGFFGKLTRTQWALGGAGVLIVILIIVIAVVVSSGNSGGGGGGNPGGVLSPSESPALAPSRDPPEMSNAPQPAPFGLTSPPESPTQAPNPRMPVEPSDTPQPTPSPTTVAPTSSPSTTQPTAFVASRTVEVMMTRGVLLCGVSPGLDGFSVMNGNTYEGFEADLCRSLAGAALGSPENVEFVEVETEYMFVALQLGSVDVLASHATHTMERDVFENSAQAGFTFSVPYLYDGLTFGGLPVYADCADRLDTTGNCTSLRICALQGSTHASGVAELLPGTQLIPLPTMKGLYDTFDSGFCDVIAGDRFEVSEAAVRRNGYTGEYQVGENLHSHEPLSLVTRDGDASWSDMVQWVVQALLAAEEQGVLMDTTESFVTTDLFGDSFTTIFRNAISAVGNYGEMYARHLESVVPRRRVNTINGGNSGLIFSFPFGSLQADGPGPTEGGTLRRILDRGHLRCGITRSPGFGEFDAATGVWSGLDVEFCRAVSAAIFNGVADDVDFRVLPATERFVALADGDIDVLSRTTTWTFARDVMEPTSGVGFSFSQPDFYDGVAVGGIPPYGRCADILDTTSPACQDLRLCVVDGTTTINVARSRFPESVLVPQLTQEEVIAGLSNGACNGIVGGVLQIVEPSVRDNGYTGPYETGQNRFSKDPLSMVTRQDDPQFTAFVNWIVTATFYAEEQGITQSTGTQMPLVSLFGPLYGRMLIDAIQSVGNYGEIYGRTVEGLVPRAGLNAANRNPFGPQHYPLPGI